MALLKPTYIGVDAIMNAYDSINADCQYFYSVWHSQKDIAFQYVGEDARKARQYLLDCLTAMAQANNDNLLYLKFHPLDKKTKYVNSRTDIIANTPICVVEPDENSNAVGAVVERDRSSDTGYNAYKMRLMLEELPATLDKKINDAIEARLLETEDGEDIEEIDPVQKTVGMITGLMSNPQIQGLIGQVLAYLKPQTPSVRVNGLNMNEQQEQQVTEKVSAETPTAEIMPVNEDMMNEALARLHGHCRLDSDLLLLADMAESNPAQFKMLLTMLRSK